MEVEEYREEDFVPDYAGEEEELESGSCGKVLTGVEEDAEQLLDPSEEMENLIVVVAQARAQLSRSVSRCWECGVTDRHMKHVLRKHLCQGKWWFLYPLSTCWGCRRMESSTHIRTCQPFELERHLVEYVGMVEEFLAYLRRLYGVGTNEGLLRLVVSLHLGNQDSHFEKKELEVLDAYDENHGLPRVGIRVLAAPRRVSSLLHWRTVQCLIIFGRRRHQRRLGRVERGVSAGVASVAAPDGARCDARVVTLREAPRSSAVAVAVLDIAGWMAG